MNLTKTHRVSSNWQNVQYTHEYLCTKQDGSKIYKPESYLSKYDKILKKHILFFSFPSFKKKDMILISLNNMLKSSQAGLRVNSRTL